MDWIWKILFTSLIISNAYFVYFNLLDRPFTTIDSTIVPSKFEYGLDKKATEFYSKFWKPIVNEERVRQIDSNKLNEILRNELENDFNNISSEIKVRAKDFSKRDLLLSFLMLRVNGSIPTYSIVHNPKNLVELLTMEAGHCQIYSARLLFLMKLFDFEGLALGFHTKSIPGHMVVDAFDPETDTSYLVDANSNFIIKLKGKNSFLRNFENLSQIEREKLFASKNFVQFPYYERYYFPGKLAFWSKGSPYPITANERNYKYTENLKKGWKITFLKEFEDLKSSLKEKEWLMPQGNYKFHELASILGISL